MLAATAFYEDPLTLFVAGMLLLILFFWYFATDVERRKRNIGSVLFVSVCAFCVLAAVPPKERLKGGIDILGGTSFTLRVQAREMEDGSFQPPTREQVDQAIAVLRKRLDNAGTNEAQITRQGADRILVQMPGVTEAENKVIRETIEKVAKLELREVSPRNDEVGANGKTLAQRVADGEEIVPNYRLYHLKGKTEDGKEFTQPILLSRRVVLGGNDIVNAYPSPQQPDAVGVTLSSAGADKMLKLTSGMRLKVDRIATVLDGEVLNAPVVNEILSRDFVISGLREPGEPRKLADALLNPLENPLIIETNNRTSATYGSALVKQAVWAGILGISITFVFVLVYYRTAGFIACFGLIVNAIILFGVMAILGIPFSLPGIAGMILTIGMAVDANVLIYERLREEISHGKSLKNAINAAYEKAFTAIFDSNVTSLITSVILFWLADSTIKGFAVTLTIGLIASMFSAILVTRVLFRWGVDTKILTKLSFLNLIPPTKIDFLGKRKLCFMVSLVLLLISAGGVIARKDTVLGVDFTGGTMIRFQLPQGEDIDMDQVNQALGEIPLTKEAYPSKEVSPATGVLLNLRCDTADAETIIAKLRDSIPLLGERTPEITAEDGTPVPSSYKVDLSKNDVSSLIGDTFLIQSLIALGAGLIGILIYIALRFEFAFAIGGFLSTIHDVLLTLGIIVLCGAELSLLHVGAILTVAGYSLNDTIVIYDRIRERLLVEHGSVQDIMNEAINSTLSRTLLTSGTTTISVVILALFGGSALRDFSITILVGIIVGTISSIYIATPIVLWWSSRKGGSLRNDVLQPAHIEIESLPSAK